MLVRFGSKYSSYVVFEDAGLIGSGVYASHGYERSHVEGALATLKTLIGYVG